MKYLYYYEVPGMLIDSARYLQTIDTLNKSQSDLQSTTTVPEKGTNKRRRTDVVLESEGYIRGKSSSIYIPREADTCCQTHAQNSQKIGRAHV